MARLTQLGNSRVKSSDFRERPYGFFFGLTSGFYSMCDESVMCVCVVKQLKNSHGQHQCRDDDNKHTCVFYSLQSSMQTLGPNVFPWSLLIKHGVL